MLLFMDWVKLVPAKPSSPCAEDKERLQQEASSASRQPDYPNLFSKSSQNAAQKHLENDVLSWN